MVGKGLGVVAAAMVVGLTSIASAESGDSVPGPLRNPSGEVKVRDFNIVDSPGNLGRVYRSDSNKYLQELWLLGRYHGQYHWTDGATREDHGYETRRLRLGAQAKILDHATLHAQMVSGSDVNPFYNGFTELWAQWSFSPEIALTMGQQKNRFTHDRNVSSRYLNYLERAMLTNMFAVDYTPAVTIQGKVSNFPYYVGVFSNGTGREIGKYFTDFNSGYSFIAASYYNFGRGLGGESATFYCSYIHSSATRNATNMNRFDDGLSSAAIFTDGHASLIAEVTAGWGSKEGNAVGLNLQYSYFFNRFLQLATRYQIASSTDAQGLLPQRRYERNVGIQPGNLYQASYAGLNYYLAKHRLKLLTGLEYVNMSAQGAWTVSTGVRFYFGPHSGGAFPMNDILPHESD